jgi:outer membrane protein TolC
MKKQLLVITTCILLHPIAFAQLTLEEIQRKARENYPLVQQYELVEKTKEYDLSNANKGYLPQLLLSGKASYQSDVTEIPVTIPGIDISPLSKDQYQVVLELNQKLWDGGETRARKEIIKQGSEVEKQRIEVELYSLRERVNQLFFGAILLEEHVKLNLLLQDELENNYNKVKALTRNGMANQADIDAIRVEQLKSEQRNTELSAALDAYKQMLSLFIGEEITPETGLIKPEIALADFHYTNNRAELRLFDAQNQLYDNTRRSIHSVSLPKIGLFAQGGYGNPGLNMLKDSFQPYFIGGLRLTWNISGLYTRDNNLKQLDVNKQKTDVQRNTFLFNSNLQISQQQNEIKKMQQVIVSDDEIIQLRKKIKEATRIKMENGIASATDLVREINAENMAIQEKTVHEIQLLINIENLKTTTNN